MSRIAVRTVGTLALGIAVAVPGLFAERAFAAWTGLVPRRAMATDVASLLAAVFFYAPAEEALKLAATWRAYRAPSLGGRLGGAMHAAAAATGFSFAVTAVYLAGRPPVALPLLRAAVALPAHAGLALGWGLALGRARERQRPPGRRFFVAWASAAVVGALVDHLAFAPGWASFTAALPLAASLAVAAIVVVRRQLGGAPVSFRRRSLLPPLPPPTLQAVREALHRAERPLTLGWIAFGALVTTGVLVVALAVAVAVARRAGIDFAAVDEGQVTTTAPLVLLGTAAMAAFPVSGWLVARASGATSVVEPAFSAAIALVGLLVLLGLAAPIALVFALASAPVAFLLACVGAWLGVSGTR